MIKEEQRKARLRLNAKKRYKKNKKIKKLYYRKNKERLLAYQKEYWGKIKKMALSAKK